MDDGLFIVCVCLGAEKELFDVDQIRSDRIGSSLGVVVKPSLDLCEGGDKIVEVWVLLAVRQDRCEIAKNRRRAHVLDRSAVNPHHQQRQHHTREMSLGLLAGPRSHARLKVACMRPRVSEKHKTLERMRERKRGRGGNKQRG